MSLAEVVIPTPIPKSLQILAKLNRSASSSQYDDYSACDSELRMSRNHQDDEEMTNRLKSILTPGRKDPTETETSDDDRDDPADDLRKETNPASAPGVIPISIRKVDSSASKAAGQSDPPPYADPNNWTGTPTAPGFGPLVQGFQYHPVHFPGLFSGTQTPGGAGIQGGHGAYTPSGGVGGISSPGSGGHCPSRAQMAGVAAGLQSPPPSDSGLRPVRLPHTPSKFAGRKGEDAGAYLKSFNDISTCNGWTEYHKLTFFHLYLTNFAERWYAAATSERKRQGKGDWTWRELEEAFVRHASCSAVRADDEWTLLMRKQKPGESALDYFYDMQNLADRVSTSMSEAMRVKHTLRGLERGLRDRIKLHDPKTMERLRDLLELDGDNESESSFGNLDDAIFMTRFPEANSNPERRRVSFETGPSRNGGNPPNRWNEGSAWQHKAWSFKGRPEPTPTRQPEPQPQSTPERTTSRNWSHRGRPYPPRQHFQQQRNDGRETVDRPATSGRPEARISPHQSPPEGYIPRSQIWDEGLCFRCKGNDHFIRDCTSTKTAENSKRRARVNPQ